MDVREQSACQLHPREEEANVGEDEGHGYHRRGFYECNM